MKRLINDAIIGLINDGLISFNRVEDLIYIKEFIDRNTTKTYIEMGKALELKEKFGVMPNVITWGDYFQTEMATALLYSTDEEFSRAVHTVKFDIISSYEIFSEKDGAFFEWVDEQYSKALLDENMSQAEKEEMFHLKILRDYYSDMGIVNHFTAAERGWYSGFEEALAM